MMLIPLALLQKFPGEWESCATKIGKNTVTFDHKSPCWQEFNARRKVFIKPVVRTSVLPADTSSWPSVDDIKRDLRHGPCCGPPVE